MSIIPDGVPEAPSKPLDPIVLFGEDPHPSGGCCECCDGYCVSDDLEWRPSIPLLVRAAVNGSTYLGTRFVVVLESLLAPLPDDAPDAVPVPNLKFATVPDALPPALDDHHTAQHMKRLVDSGLEARGTDGLVRHLYLDGQHVGWTSVASPEPDARYGSAVIRRADYALVTKIADTCGIGLNAAAAALNVMRAGVTA